MQVKTIIITLHKDALPTVEIEGSRKPYAPEIVVITGHGVLSKPYLASDPSIARITENDEILWSRCNDMLSFVRKSSVEHQLSAYKNTIKTIISVSIDQRFKDDIPKTFNREFGTIKRLSKCDNAANIVCHAWEGQLRMPILVSVLIILIANFFINSDLRDKNEAIQARLQHVLRRAETNRQMAEGSAKLSEQITPIRAMKSSIIIDRLAARLPEGARFTHVAIDPMIRAAESGRQAQIKTGILILRGSAPSVETVTDMVQTFNILDVCRNLKISSIERDKERMTLNFEVEGTL